MWEVCLIRDPLLCVSVSFCRGVGGASKIIRPLNNLWDIQTWRQSDGFHVKLGIKRVISYFHFFVSLSASSIKDMLSVLLDLFIFWGIILYSLATFFCCVFFPLLNIIRNYFLFKFSPINCSDEANEFTVSLCFKESTSVWKLWKEPCYSGILFYEAITVIR